MSLNPLAVEANQAIQSDCPVVYDLLSDLGKRFFFPAKGILAQAADAKTRGTRYNATAGIATDGKVPLHLECIDRYFSGLEPKDLYPYAPSSGKPSLREAWAAKQREESPSLGDHPVSLPVVTNALTHGLALLGDLFLQQGDELLLADQQWENYLLCWETRQQVTVGTYPFFDEALTRFNVEAFREALAARQGKKVVTVLNFPNNPSGYTLLKDEAAAVVAALTEAAAAGTRLVVVCDDAYYGMVYDDRCQTESLFGKLAQAHENLLAIKVDGATKEEFVWGLRVGFLTYGVKNGTEAAYKALAAKTSGLIRGTVSNINMPGQSIIERAIADPAFREQQAATVAILRERGQISREAAYDQQYQDCWDVYPFNAGYFMCLRLKGVKAEEARQHLLDEHQVGLIALGEFDLRVAFSCVPVEHIKDLFARVAASVRALR